MATELAPPQTVARLWQVPTFILGLIAVAAVTVGRPYLLGLTPNSPARLLEEARSFLIANPPDAGAAIQRTQRIVDLSELPTKSRGEAHFLLGWAQLLKCESANPTEATQLQTQARQHLERADQFGVSDADKPRLSMRLAKVWLLTGTDVHQIIKLLARTADTADDPYEAYGMLAEAYAKLPQPDTAGLTEAVRQQVARAPATTDPAKLARTRLRLAELLLQAQNIREARVVLSRIAGDAPPEVLLTARNLLVRCLEESKDWASAAKAWEQVASDPRLTGTDKARVFYALGNAYALNQQLNEAIAAWQSTLAIGGLEGQAAALRIAELKLETDPRGALAALSESLKNVLKPEDFQNPLIPNADLQALFEHASERLRAKGDFDSAAELAKLYAKVAPPGSAFALQGMAAAARADACDREGQAEAGRASRTEAARSYAFAAAQLGGAESAAWLWLAADQAIKAKEFALALESLGKYVVIDAVEPDRQAEAWIALGRLHEEMKNIGEAKAAYQRCLKYAAPWKNKARYHLAIMEFSDARRDEKARQNPKLDDADRLQLELRAKVKFDDAEKLLQDNLTEMRQAPLADATVQELTVFAIADVAYERGDYPTAEPRLRGALQEYPNSGKAIRGRYLLAHCLHRKAWDDFNTLSKDIAADKRQKVQQQYLENLSGATEQFDRVEKLVLAKPANQLDADDREMLTRAAFAVGELLYRTERYSEAMMKFEDLAKRYAGEVEGLHALHQLWMCQFYYLKDNAKALDSMTRLRDSMDKMPDKSFDASSPMHDKNYWVEKIVEMGRRMNE